jgi:hypothetical protein
MKRKTHVVETKTHLVDRVIGMITNFGPNSLKKISVSLVVKLDTVTVAPRVRFPD